METRPMNGDIEAAFREAMSNAGIVTDAPIVADGKLRRFHVEGDAPGSKNGWGIAFPDGVPAGAFGSWRTGVSETWSAIETSKLSPQDRETFACQIKAAQVERDREEKRINKKASLRAQQLWDNAEPAPDSHPYLEKKQIKPHGLRVHNGSLVVPLRDTAGVIHSLQYIAKDGTKRFLTGGRVSGCYYSIGKPNGIIYVAEGFSTAATDHEVTNEAVVAAFSAGNLKSVARELRGKYPDVTLVIAGDNDYQTERNPGKTKAIEAARAVNGLVALPIFKDGCPGSDFNDLFIAEGKQAVKQQLEAAAVPPPSSNDSQVGIEAWLKSNSIDPDSIQGDLQALSPVQYDRLRNKVAEHAGIRVATLDELVNVNREPKGIEGQGGSIDWENITPWPEPVDGALLLDELVSTFRRYIILPECAAEFIALWSVHTHAHEAAFISPYLAITSPEKRCGKTHTLEILNFLVPKPLPASNITPSCLFRAIDKYHPTLLVDEADTFVKRNEELAGILNSGHSKASAHVWRTVGDDYNPRRFSTWAPKAIALIGKMRDTLMDRSIIISIRRKTDEERVEEFRIDRIGDECEPPRRKVARWVADHFDEIKVIEPEVSKALNDREKDNWRPLLSIADIAGGDWPKRARQAAETLSGYGDTDSDSFKVQLLEDIQAAFKEISNPDKIKTEDLLQYLNSLEDHPWCEWKKGNPMSARNLSTLLRPFGIKSKDYRFNGEVKKGYAISEFKESFLRYLPPQSATSATELFNNNLREAKSATESENVADKYSRNTCNNSLVADVADRNPLPGGRKGQKILDSSSDLVQCGDCRYFRPNPKDAERGVGECVLDAPFTKQDPPKPSAYRKCLQFEAKAQPSPSPSPSGA
ncbi:DUF3631 domain-containing protein [Candidatus Neomarinimicrobiota bacterium]